MLAYIFWHRPITAGEAYENSLLAFHERLAGLGVPGFIRSESYRIGPTAWLDAEPGYEDWYLVEASWALDPLNSAAVSAAMRTSHDAAANAMAVGHGGLYGLLFGSEAPRLTAKCTWLIRPRGISFEEPLQAIAASVANATVWRRRMVLGPAPEFAVHGEPDTEPSVPDDWRSVSITRELVAP